ncbi:MAG: urease accessory protein UreD [Desulfocapsa sp.]|nr:urease accessory protein UreD [Desulfocapsa sp.]MBN4048657.1 urease accessory protein UreD [bacterium AH-315-N22]
MENGQSKGWNASLQLKYIQRRGRTVLARNIHSGPLVVQRPLYPEGGVCHTCILHPPGGVVGGDHLKMDILAEKKTSTLITTPGATKFYRSAGKTAVQEQHLCIEDGAMLEWLPQGNIIFPGANAEINTTIDLAAGAKFMGWEILCLGLPVNNQRFDHGKLFTSLVVRRQKIPLLIERLRVHEHQELSRCAGLRDFPIIATFIATDCTSETLSPLRSLTPHEKEALYGVTLMDGLLVVRYLGFSTFAAQGLFTHIWKLLRPKITKTNACPPRIWAT